MRKQLSDIASTIYCPNFVVTNYDQYSFGHFYDDYERADVTPPLDFRLREPCTILKCMVFWTALSYTSPESVSDETPDARQKCLAGQDAEMSKLPKLPCYDEYPCFAGVWMNWEGDMVAELLRTS